uniref:Si:ch211-242b18.1 n=1 Tax=Takifugu rubripes TaxID=31033 RepID=A0A674MQ37_TAKRU
MERVASLEVQLKQISSSSGHRKYNSLIQTQARELSHLRQRMREGQRVCHILTQNMGDTTKAFEELLRANDIDYYMGQSFREQLAQNIALAQRVVTKISGRKDQQLSKELQHKDKIIESLHTKLNLRPETPSSCQALSETTDPSDRTSPVSDECRTNEDLELCSDLDSREYQQEHRLQQPEGGSELDGVNLIEEHLREVRCLRQRLEESIRTNERLRQQLEDRLATTGQMSGGDAAARGGVHSSCQAETGGAGGRAVEGGAETASDS